MKILKRLLLTILPLVILPAMLSGIFSITEIMSAKMRLNELTGIVEKLKSVSDKSTDTLEKSVIAKIQSDYSYIAVQIKTNLLLKLEGLQKILETEASNKNIGRFLNSKQTDKKYAAIDIMPILQQFVTGYGCAEAVLLDEHGREILRSAGKYVPDGGDPIFDFSLIDNKTEDESKSSWFLMTTQPNQPFFTVYPYFSDNYDKPRPVLSLTVPLKYTLGRYDPAYGSVKGFLHINIEIEKLVDDILGRSKTPDGSFLFTDGGGRILYAKDRSLTGMVISDAVIRPDINNIVSEPVYDNLFTLHIVNDKNDIIASAKQIKILSSEIRTWVDNSKNVFDGLNRELYRTIILLFLFFSLVQIIAIYIIYIMSKKISSPITALAHVADEIGDGNLNAKIEIDGSFSSEIGTLAEIIEEMRLKIRTHIEELDHLVEERTQQLKAANQELQKLADMDGLTKVPNRRSFDRQLTAEFARAVRDKTHLSLIMCDVDFFKQFNDTYGHQAGDECLKSVAACLDSATRRPADMAARYGGEEFALLLPATDSDGAMLVAETLRKRILMMNIEHSGSKAAAVVTISIGVCSVVPDNDINPEKLIQMADSALYSAKSLGRNQTVLYQQ